jgi:hypothetical protein
MPIVDLAPDATLPRPVARDRRMTGPPVQRFLFGHSPSVVVYDCSGRCS